MQNGERGESEGKRAERHWSREEGEEGEASEEERDGGRAMYLVVQCGQIGASSVSLRSCLDVHHQCVVLPSIRTNVAFPPRHAGMTCGTAPSSSGHWHG